MVRTIRHENRMSPTGVSRGDDRSDVLIPSRLQWRMANLADLSYSMSANWPRPLVVRDQCRPSATPGRYQYLTRHPGG